MTFKDLINEVLIRLREDTIGVEWTGDINASNQITAYQKVIGSLVNDAKQNVESYHDWSSSYNYTAISTDTLNSTYELEGAGYGPMILSIYNTVTGTQLKQMSYDYFIKQAVPVVDISTGEPTHYLLRGNSGGDVRIALHPRPDDVYTVLVEYVALQEKLTTYDAILKVPAQPVILGAWARAIAERGEDGGTISSAVAAEAREALTTAIQVDSGNYEYAKEWVVA